METIKGTVKHIVFSNEDTGFKVLKIKTVGGPTLSITGEFGPEIIPETQAIFHGDYKAHTKYGTSLRVASYSITHNQEEANSFKLFIDDVAMNIGPERARALTDYFGEELINILDQEPQRLEEVEGIGKVSADSLREAWSKKKDEWHNNRKIYSLRSFLNSLGIKERRVKKILSHFDGGFNAEEKIRENPYILTEIEGFGFSTADYVAKRLGVPESDPLRLRAFIFYALNILCPSNGHLYLLKDDLVKATNKYCLENATSFLGKASLVEEDIIEPVTNLRNDKQIIEDGDALYSQKCFFYENDSALKLERIMLEPSNLITLENKDVEEHIQAFEKNNTIQLSEKQKEALRLFIEKKVFILTGGPGTGKTSTLKALVSLILKLRLRLTCMTPTGISAKKLADTINYDAYTIHRRLGFKGNDWTYNEGNKFDTDVVVVDEASMVDMELFYRMLAALKPHVHIILVGDDNQLPSVGAGNVLRDLINCGSIPVVKLEQIFRQAETSDIVELAHKIKNGDPDLKNFKTDPNSDVFFIRENNLEKIEAFVIKLAQKFKDEKRLFQILSPRNQGPLSVDLLNDTLQKVLNPPSDLLPEIKCFNFILRKGDRIKVKKNDYEHGIYNGDVGKVVFIGGGYIDLLIDERIVKLAIGEIEEKIKLAYTLSVHACVPGDTLVSTPNGQKPIKDIKVGDFVTTKNHRAQKVLLHTNNGAFKVVKIKTSRGYYVESSDTHKFLIRDEKGNERFKEAKDLKKGFYVCLNRDALEGGKEIPLSALNSSGNGQSSRHEVIPFSDAIRKEFLSNFNPEKTRGKKGQKLNAPRFKKMYTILQDIEAGLYDLTWDTLGLMANALSAINKPLFKDMSDIIENNFLYEMVESVEITEDSKDMYDIEVEGEHLYSANGFVCHNSQGQEYPFIILPFINQFGKMLLQRNLLYTAITRAKKKVIIIGHGSALEKAINNASVYKRNTKLGERINLCFHSKKRNSLLELPGEQVIGLCAPKKKEPSSLEDPDCLAVATTEEY